MRGEAWLWFVRGGGFLMGAAIAFGLIYTMIVGARVVVLVFIALLLASGLEPLIDRIRARTPLGRGATLLLVYFGFFVTVAALLLFVLPSAIDQFGQLGTRLTPLLDDAREWARTLDRGVSLAVVGLIDTIQQAFAPRGVSVPDPEELIALGLTFAEIVITIASLLTLVYFWLTERARLQRFALALLPYERRAGAREAWNEIEVRLGAWVRGQLILMGSVGVATSIAYFLIGLEGALLLGLIAALCEVIPIIGPALGAVPALIVAALTGRIEIVLIVAVVYFIIQVVEGNILVPLVMHNTIGVPPFLVFVSILGGAAVAGIPGALVSVPLVAALLVLVERLQARDSPVPLSGQAPPEQIPEIAEAVEAMAAKGS
ncbi:MAG TPA: AI-2E family transporter [Candidatus Limnocylindrales bacterium]|nr:AI-2E family transporter [Candidatus Limnocylindrales bacterium]